MPLERFAVGINAWLALCRRGARPRPVEFVRLGRHPADWRPEDCILFPLAQGVLLDLELPELAEAETLRTHDPLWFERRRRYESDWIIPTIPDSRRRGAVRATHAAAPPWTSERRGRGSGTISPALGGRARAGAGSVSDAFVVGPARTVNGAPLLANDVHPSFTAPGPFHVDPRDRVPDTVDAAWRVRPGLPIVVSGRNRRAAWGITSSPPT